MARWEQPLASCEICIAATASTWRWCNDAAEQTPAVPVDWLGPRREARGVILYFHGNGEVADDYVDLAPQFHWLGFHLMIVDYRGYGWSSPSTPLMSHLLSDVEPLLLNNAFDSALDKAGVPKDTVILRAAYCLAARWARIVRCTARRCARSASRLGT